MTYVIRTGAVLLLLTFAFLFRFQATQQQKAAQKKAQFESTQRQAKSALINKILNEVTVKLLRIMGLILDRLFIRERKCNFIIWLKIDHVMFINKRYLYVLEKYMANNS